MRTREELKTLLDQARDALRRAGDALNAVMVVEKSMYSQLSQCKLPYPRDLQAEYDTAMRTVGAARRAEVSAHEAVHDAHEALLALDYLDKARRLQKKRPHVAALLVAAGDGDTVAQQALAKHRLAKKEWSLVNGTYYLLTRDASLLSHALKLLQEDQEDK